MSYTPEDRRIAATALMEARAECQRGRDALADVEDCLPGDGDVFEELAGLIDPTSRVEVMDEAGTSPWNDGGTRLGTATYGCSECGYPYGAYAHFAFHGMPSGVPRFCPNCGARQVVHGER